MRVASSAHHCDVLVVGLGPVGAALALLLERRGVSTALVRPDRYAFGTGAAGALEDAFAAQLAPQAPLTAPTVVVQRAAKLPEAAS